MQTTLETSVKIVNYTLNECKCLALGDGYCLVKPLGYGFPDCDFGVWHSSLPPSHVCYANTTVSFMGVDLVQYDCKFHGR
jgi:hypothetical protein